MAEQGERRPVLEWRECDWDGALHASANASAANVAAAAAVARANEAAEDTSALGEELRKLEWDAYSNPAPMPRTSMRYRGCPSCGERPVYAGMDWRDAIQRIGRPDRVVAKRAEAAALRMRLRKLDEELERMDPSGEQTRAFLEERQERTWFEKVPLGGEEQAA